MHCGSLCSHYYSSPYLIEGEVYSQFTQSGTGRTSPDHLIKAMQRPLLQCVIITE